MEKAKVKESFIENMFQKIKTMQGKNDIKNSAAVNPFGYDSVPYEGVTAVRTDTKSDTVIVGYIQVAFKDLEVGESVMFSKTKEGYKATIVCRNSGNIELNGTGDFLVRFNALEQWVKSIAIAINSHTHTYAPGPLTPVQTGIPSATISNDISESKAKTLKTK
jgi:hypothetical protein